MTEAEIIELFQNHPLRVHRNDVLIGSGDDCAVLQVPLGQALAVSTDTLLAGVHFPIDFAPYDIGYKALAVNLSDLAAMGAEPAWATVALTLVEANPDWLMAFANGLFALAHQFNVAVVGGNITKGRELAINIQVQGFVPPAQALRRSGAKVGDAIYVSGYLGKGIAHHYYHCPHPQINLGLALRGKAHSAIDISDGLAQDLQHILIASGVGATIYVDQLPIVSDLAQNYRAALTSGDDYELCFTTLPDLTLSDHQITCIGHIDAQLGLRIMQSDNQLLLLDCLGYRHF